MKRLITLQILAIFLAVPLMAQYGYIPEKLSGDLYLRDLTNPGNAVLKGSGPNQLAGADFDLNGNLYALKESSGEFYQIDTSNAAATLIATVTPSGGQFWSGIACDPTDGTMYICSTDGNTNSFYTIDVTNGSTALVGTNGADDGVVGIAFDNSGQMYAIYLVGKFYKIDKSNATPTFVGNMASAARGLTHHGLDFDEANETMYMVSYNVFTFDNELWTIDLTTGSNTLVGSVGLWAGAIAVAPVFTAGFSADATEVCEGDVVNFTDQSTGAVSWSWTFEGGNPGTSTAQNPSVTYNNAGTWDVTLEVSNGNGTTSLTVTDYISVDAIPGQAVTPTGPDEVCGGETVNYTTTAVTGADSYEWVVDPSDAGTIIGTGTTGAYTAATDWTGSFTVSVRASSSCGDGAWSPSLSATLFESPEEFFLTGGGGYCEGEAGRELYLDGSEVGVDYELFFAGTTTGMVVAGDGDSISFGFHTDQGLYTASGFTTTCTSNMDGQPFIFIQPVPGQPGAVEGPQNVCNNGISQYTTTGSDDADTLVWSVEPADAGVLFPGDLMVEVDWDDAFSGNATLSYYGSNDCGNSDTAFLEITVSDTPAPEVSGPELVCEGDLAEYQAEENAGSYYSWDVTGGSITSGAGTHMITVEWGSPGTGFVTVTEDNGACQGNSAEFAVSIDDCVGIDEFEMQEAIVYPNPAGSSLNIALPGQEHVYLRIVSMIGHMVMETEQVDMTGGETRLNVEALEDGVYFIHIVNMEGNSWVGKFIKAE